jgi:hypothetical protein
MLVLFHWNCILPLTTTLAGAVCATTGDDQPHTSTTAATDLQPDIPPPCRVPFVTVRRNNGDAAQTVA